MTKPTLIVLAAGMGSRYGGLKQIDPVGPSGEMIMDYSAYDAIKAGCGRIVFIIKEEMEALFKEQVGNRIASAIPVDYAFQRSDDLPAGLSPHPTRVKPWGTAHAIYCCRDVIHEPFMVINADDFYGAETFVIVSEFLKKPSNDAKHQICMAGYYVENTLTEYGTVARGVCELSDDEKLVGIVERTSIGWKDGEIVFNEDTGSTVVPPGTVVSMNFWGFYPESMSELEASMVRFFDDYRDNLDKAEFFLPIFVNGLVKEGKADVTVLKTRAQWHGVTYRDDKPALQEAIEKLINEGKYPRKLW